MQIVYLQAFQISILTNVKSTLYLISNINKVNNKKIALEKHKSSYYWI